MAHQTLPASPVEEQRRTMTYDEFLAWTDDAVHAEWVNGEAIIFMPPKLKHQAIVGLLHTLLSLFTELFELGAVYVAPFEMRALPGGPSREPDLLFVTRDHLDRLSPERLNGPADLIVEVVSEDSLYRDRSDKFDEYQEAGVREYWMIDSRPAKERIDVYHLAPDGKFLALLPDERGRYHSAILPGFWLDPTWLWQEPLPNALPLLAQIAPQALRRSLTATETESGAKGSGA